MDNQNALEFLRACHPGGSEPLPEEVVHIVNHKSIGRLVTVTAEVLCNDGLTRTVTAIEYITHGRSGSDGGDPPDCEIEYFATEA